MRNKRIEYIIDEILDQYAYADESTRPWIIGFSGGKDSTVLLMLVWIALEKLKELPGPFQLRRPIYVVCNDTMVENPIIASYVDQVLAYIIHSGFISGYQNRYGDNLKPPTNVYHRMTA